MLLLWKNEDGTHEEVLKINDTGEIFLNGQKIGEDSRLPTLIKNPKLDWTPNDSLPEASIRDQE